MHTRPECDQTGECGDEHQQRRLRQMEISQQLIDDPEAKTRCNEERRFARARAHLRLRIIGCRFQCSQACRADCNYAAARCARCVDRVRGLLRNFITLRVHSVLRNSFNADRLERARADVQRHVREFDAAFAQKSQQAGGEVKAGSRRRNRARARRVYGLITKRIN